MADWPYVSVVVPAFNASDTIDDLLRSLMALRYPRERHEIIVVDNNSTDDTPRLVQQYPVSLIYERGVQSSYAARNRGVKAARGELIAFTDADCVTHPDWLCRLLADHQDHQWGGFAGGFEAYQPETDVQRFLASIGWFSASFNQVSSSLGPQSRGERLLMHFKILDYRSRLSLPDGLLNPPTANVAYRRDVFDQIGGFDECLTSGGDMDFAWRVQTQTAWRIKLVTEALVYHQHRRDIAGLAGLYRKNGWGAGLLALKYGSNPHQTARQMGFESLLLICFSVARHSLDLGVRLSGSLFRRPVDSLYLKTPIFAVLGSVNFYYGRLTAAIRGNRRLFHRLT